MGGSSKKPAAPAATPTQPTMTVQPFMPGMQQALADQLSMGYGQQPADLMTYLSSFYKTMSIPDFSQKGFVPPTPDKKPTTDAPKGMGRR